MGRGRYAPSPTGGLHLGNARTALAAWLRARSRGGPFVLRVEDLDGPRTVPEAVNGNLDELRWLGLDWDEGPDVGGPHVPYRQSQRFDLYESALVRLEAAGRLFDCYLSRKDLRELASAPHGPMPPYGAAQRAANARLAPAKRRAGKAPSQRFRGGEGTVTFDDLVAGPQRVDAATGVGDVVVHRADGQWAYALAVVVDDARMGIEEVVRGDDLLAASAAQVLLHRALDGTPPRFAHLPLLLDVDGERMSKRAGARTLHAMREAGVPPERVVGLLAAGLGLLDAPRPVRPHELLDVFDLDRIPRDPARLRVADLAWLDSAAGAR